MSDTEPAQRAESVAPSRLVLADALKTLVQHVEFHEQRNMLVGDLTYTIRRMIEDKGCKAPWDEMLQRHLARIDGDGGVS